MKLLPDINHKRCNLCGRCVKVCPRTVLGIVNKKLEIVRDDCMLCSQCYDVCGENAIGFHEEILRGPYFKTFKYSEKTVKPSDINKAELINIFRSRRSVRNYQDKKVPDSVLKDLVEFAVTAPSASNRQDWDFIIINGRDRVWALAQKIGQFFEHINTLAKNPVIRNLSVLFMGKKLVNYYNDKMASVENALKAARAGKDQLFWGAPAVIIIHGPKEGSMPLEDAQYASYNIALLAQAFDLGTCYVGYALEAIKRDRILQQYLAIPAGNVAHAVLVIGYPDMKYFRPSLRKNYKISWL
jgi:nitroreductase/NAD-dependent dihydropyrimidine dehydrogenase PreA subunit